MENTETPIFPRGKSDETTSRCGNSPQNKAPWTRMRCEMHAWSPWLPFGHIGCPECSASHCPRPAGPLSRAAGPTGQRPPFKPGSWGALHRDRGPGWPGHQDLMGRTTRVESPARREPGSLRNKAGLSTSLIRTATSPVSQEGQAAGSDLGRRAQSSKVQQMA